MKAAAAFISTSMSSKCMQTSNSTHPSGFLLPATSYVQHLIGFETFQRTAPWQSFLPQSGSHLRLTAGAAIRQTSSPTSLKNNIERIDTLRYRCWWIRQILHVYIYIWHVIIPIQKYNYRHNNGAIAEGRLKNISIYMYVYIYIHTLHWFQTRDHSSKTFKHQLEKMWRDHSSDGPINMDAFCTWRLHILTCLQPNQAPNSSNNATRLGKNSILWQVHFTFRWIW